LLSAGTVLSASFSGCSAVPELPGESRRTSIADVVVKNLGDSPTVFDVVVEDAERDEIVFWGSYTARPLADWDDDGNDEIDMHSWNTPVRSPGRYVLHARSKADGSEGEIQVESARLQAGADCVSVIVEIDIVGELAIDVDRADAC
jgi:hypothetical protein